MRPLSLNLPCGCPEDVMFDHIRHAMALDLPPFLMGKENGRQLIVCGNGPSLKGQIKAIRSRKADIIAVQGADRVLLEAGIVPKYVAAMDGGEMTKHMLAPHDEPTYLIASMCAPDVFDLLKDKKVVLWHADNLRDEAAMLEREFPGKPFIVIGGGCTIGLRCINLGYLLGYRKFHLYGMDSCIADGTLHSAPGKEDHLAMDGKVFEVECAGRKFSVVPFLAQQAQDFVMLMRKTFSGKIDVIAHGDGLIPHICRTMRAGGECRRNGHG